MLVDAASDDGDEVDEESVDEEEAPRLKTAEQDMEGDSEEEAEEVVLIQAADDSDDDDDDDGDDDDVGGDNKGKVELPKLAINHVINQ